MPRPRRVPATQQSAPKPASTGRQALREKTNTTRTRASAPIYEDDGHTEDLVKDVKTRRGRTRKTQQSTDEPVMAGGLGVAAFEGAATSDEATTPLDSLAQQDEGPVLGVRLNKRPARALRRVKQSGAQSKVLENLKQRMNATAHEEKAKQAYAPPPVSTSVPPTASDKPSSPRPLSQTAGAEIPKRSDLSPSPSPPAPSKLSSIKGKRMSTIPPGSALRTQSTPAIESSLMALRNFKRRPRQPSMLQMVQQRTASAAPSITNTAIEIDTGDDSSDFDLDMEAEDEDDFAPDAEGTPLHARASKALATTHSLPPLRNNTSPSSISNSRKRKSEHSQAPLSSEVGSRAKRRKSATAGNEEQENAVPVAELVIERRATPERTVTSVVQVTNSPSSSAASIDTVPSHPQLSAKQDELIIPSTERNDDEPQDVRRHSLSDETGNGTMADPLSSSPLRQGGSQVDHLAYPATQVSPVTAKSRPRKKAKPISTAMLQSMLPKKRAPLRRRHKNSEYDFDTDEDEDEDEDTPIDVSHLDEDEDELGGRPRQPLRNKAAKGSTVRRTIRGRPKQTATTPVRKSQTHISSKKLPKTYGRATMSDKENEDYRLPEDEDGEEEESTLPEISVSMQEAIKSKEIEEAKRKFADIDTWEMQFETVSEDPHHRSSSQDWR